MNNLGCSYLEDGINFDVDFVSDCCILHNDGRGMPKLIENYHGEMIDWNSLFEKKAQRIAAQKEKTIYDCENCFRLMPYEFSLEHKISEFHFSHCRACNAKCIYCSDEQSGGNVNYNTYPVIKDLIEKGFYKPGGEATLQGGEPLLMQDFESLVDLFIQNGTSIRVHTSAIKYSDKIEQALKQNKGSVVISIDCGCSQTYKKIKQVDAFDSVVENIRKYAAASAENVIVKFILIPGINDNLNEINKFFELMKKLNIKKIALDIEVQYGRKHQNKYVSPHIYLLNDYFELMAKKNNMELLIYSFLFYVQRNRQIKKSIFTGSNFIFNWVLNHYNQKDKNIIYSR